MLTSLTEQAIVAAAPPFASGPLESFAWDFGLAEDGPIVSLSADIRTRRATQGLLFGFAVTGLHSKCGAVLTLRPARRLQQRPVLHARPTLLRAPPIPGRALTLCSLTLGRLGPDGRMVGWAERLLQRRDWDDRAIADRTASLIRTMIETRLGGTWWGAAPRISAAGRAVIFASGDDRPARHMLMAALREHDAGRTILVIPRARGLAALCARLGVAVLEGAIDPWPLLEEADSVHTSGGHDAGILARLLGARTRCHGSGSLAAADPLRLAAAALVHTARYVDPFTRQPIACESFIALAAEWRRQSAAAAEIACCVGVSFWKRRRISGMLGGARKPTFRRSAASAVASAQYRGGTIAVWASRAPSDLNRDAQAAGVAVARIEDGFVRSVGLGADFLPPLSIVLDGLGLYYDASAPSDLEVLLTTSRFGPELTRRAGQLRAHIVQQGVTKYNLPANAAPEIRSGLRLILLVPGQVSDDRSVLLGGGGTGPGLELLAAVRRHRPDTFIVYKPHPDVEAGHRPGALADSDVLHFADRIVRAASMATLLDAVDEVHTLTSLTGFEALLRGKPVTTYGQPFYAGWGLTTDLNPIPRRTRRLSLDELVAGVLILYPRYFDPVTGLPCSPEVTLRRVAEHRAQPHSPGLLIRARRLQGLVSRNLNALRHRALQKGASR